MIQKLGVESDLVDFDLFCAIVGDGQKADLIDGVIYTASPDSLPANAIGLFIAHLIDGYISAKGIAGFVYGSRVACRFNNHNAPEPDVVYVRPERSDILEETCIRGAPDIAVEIVSRDSRQRDYGDKRQLYERAGVAEYWIIDPLQKRCEFLRLQDGRYQLVPLDDNRIFRSSVIPGLGLNIEWLLARPLPKAHDCLPALLS
jgi:Uma2 family endonuclease